MCEQQIVNIPAQTMCENLLKTAVCDIEHAKLIVNRINKIYSISKNLRRGLIDGVGSVAKNSIRNYGCKWWKINKKTTVITE